MTDRRRKSTGNRYLPLVAALCAECEWPAPVAEYRFDPDRRWRFDLAWPATRLAVEVHGGIWTAGRHTRGSGQLKDWEKLNAAALDGWRVLQVSPAQVTDGTLLTLLMVAFDEGEHTR